jgi:hypothetical protein
MNWRDSPEVHIIAWWLLVILLTVPLVLGTLIAGRPQAI